MDVRSFLSQLELILQKHVKNNYPRYWNEDFISMSIMKEIEQTLSTVTIEGLKERMNVEWSAFKQTGIPEQKFGDLAFLVNIKYQDGDIIEGATFLEAKKRRPKKTRFEAIRISQLRKISKNAPHSMVLLYDYDDITQFANTYNSSFFWNWFPLKPCTYSVVVPMNTIIETKKRDSTLYKFSLPFSHQLFFRYLHGFDLEYDKKAIEIAKGYAMKKGFPKYLMVASVAFGNTEPYRDITFNKNRFRKINGFEQ